MKAVAGVIALALAAWVVPASADGGEAGLVVQHGDGTVDTYCIAFSGDGITGDQLLKRAGVSAEHVNGLVCAVGKSPNEGCYGAGTFETCTCQCRTPGSNCTYWAFFTQKHGQGWVYAALGFMVQKAKDGEMQAWRWGKGGANSAPPPGAITFEQVCGHAPGTNPATALPAAATPAQGSATTPNPATAAPPQATAAGSPGSTLAPTPSVAPTDTAGGPITPAGPITPLAPESLTIAAGQGTPPTGEAASQPRGGGAGTALSFAAVAAGLIAAIVAGAWWRNRHGA